jgi:uncharacterized protein
VRLSSTPRSILTRKPERASTDRADLYAVLDLGLVGHLGFVRDGAPVVLPIGYGRKDDTVYLHASTGSGLVEALDGGDACFTVTMLDGIVYARSVFDHSMNYRSAVMHGRCNRVDDPAKKLEALETIVEHLAPGSWAYARQPSRKELAATAVFALSLAEASVKIRTGPPIDDPQDVRAGHRWAGVLPIKTTFTEPEPSADLAADVRLPPHIATRATPR